LFVVVFYNSFDEVGGKPTLLVKKKDGIVLLVPDTYSM